MRAIFYPFMKDDHLEIISIKNESAKHLQVVRVKLDDEILVLNGVGARAYTKIVNISKTQVDLFVSRVEESVRCHSINLAIANPKKEAFEDILKISVEMGVVNIFPLKSDYSQYDFIKNERVERIIESALVQSNNAFLPIIHEQVSLLQFLDQLNTPLFFLNSRPMGNVKINKSFDEITLLIGPEGGFSLSEEELITSKAGVISIHMPTPIQRAPTAVASSIGYLLSP